MPSGLALSAVTGTGFTLSWSASTDNVGVTGYELYLNGSKIGTTRATSYGFSGLSCGTGYTLSVDSYDAAGNRSSKVAVQASTSPCADAQAPSAPSGLALNGATGTGFTLSWSASTDNVGVTGYELYLNGSKIGTTGATSYSFGGLSCGTSYTLAVDAYDAAGNRSSTSAAQASTSPCPDTQAPTTPPLLVESSSTASSISLSWAASLDNVGVAGYTIYASGSKAGTTGLTLYSVTNLACGHSYTVGVDAYDAAGNHSPQDSIVASTAPCPSPPTNSALPAISGATTVGSTLSATQGAWSGNPTGYGYRWRRCDITGNTCSDISGAGASTYTLTTADQASTLRVAVTATNTNGSSTASSMPTAVITAAPTAPSPSPPSVTFDGGFDTGDTSQWQHPMFDNDPNHQMIAGDFSAVSAPLRQGTFAGKFVVKDGDCPFSCPSAERTEVYLDPNNTKGNEGQDEWYAWSSYFPNTDPSRGDTSNPGYGNTAGSTNGQNMFTQWHGIYSGEANIGLSIGKIGCSSCGWKLQFFAEGGQLPPNSTKFPIPGGMSGYVASDLTYVNLASMTNLWNRWLDFRVHIHWSSTGSGSVEVKMAHDGGPFTDIYPQTSGPTLYVSGNSTQGNGAYLKQGWYRMYNGTPWGTSTVYHDGMRIGPTEASVSGY